MEGLSRIALVEDSVPQRQLMTRILEADYLVTAFESGEAFLADDREFDIILLDIEMPGINGYETCRRLRSREAEKRIPVIFVSGHDTAPERVAAYEAGGDDFVIKPYSPPELIRKIGTILNLNQRLEELASQSSFATKIAFDAMTSMGDLGVVIEFMRRSALARDSAETAEMLIEAMKSWGLKGVVQIRGMSGDATLTTDEAMTPLQASVMATMKDIGRLFDFGSRAIVNYSHATLLVENLPTDDSVKVGRLRDHLAVLAECADMRIAGLDSTLANQSHREDIDTATRTLMDSLDQISRQHREFRMNGRQTLTEHLEMLTRTLLSLGLPDHQETFVRELSEDIMDSTLEVFDQSDHLDDEFESLKRKLQTLFS